MILLPQFAFDRPWLLLLLVVCVPILRGHGARWLNYASLAGTPTDHLSNALELGLRLLACVPVVALVLGLAGLHARQQSIVRSGVGADVVVALDRSLSMDEPFALRGEKSQETKTAAAARLVAAFFARRPHDSFAVVAFSTAPIQAMPLTAHRAAIAAAIAAMRGKALANTDIGAGIAMGLTQFDGDPSGAARVLLLVSDGAGEIPERTRDTIRRLVQQNHAHLYYLYLRSGDDPPLAAADDDGDLTHPAGLDAFFRTLQTPYQAFEARDAGAVEAAIRRVEALETQPISYRETVPRRDLDRLCDICAAVFLLASLAAQCAERGLQPSPRERAS